MCCVSFSINERKDWVDRLKKLCSTLVICSNILTSYLHTGVWGVGMWGSYIFMDGKEKKKGYNIRRKKLGREGKSLGGTYILRHTGMCHSNGSLFHKKSLNMGFIFYKIISKHAYVFQNFYGEHPKIGKICLYFKKNP